MFRLISQNVVNFGLNFQERYEKHLFIFLVENLSQKVTWKIELTLTACTITSNLIVAKKHGVWLQEANCHKLLICQW